MKTFLTLLLFTSLMLGSAYLAAADKVNVNEADAASLARALHGVGNARAEAIVAYREAHGPFRSVHELTRVPGIGPYTVEQNIDLIDLGASEPAE